MERGVSSISVCHLVDEGGVEAFLQMGGVRRYGKEGERGECIYDDPQHPPCFGGGFLSSMTVGTSFVEAGRTGGVFGSFLAIATKSSFTFAAVLAEVSINNIPFSSEYACDSSISTVRLDAKSTLLPASAITMLGFPCRCSSFTHFLALSNES